MKSLWYGVSNAEVLFAQSNFFGCFYRIFYADLTFSLFFCACNTQNISQKGIWVSAIHCRNCKVDRWDTSTDSTNKINPSAPMNCISACLLSLNLFSPVQTSGSLPMQYYIGCMVYLLADKFVKPRETLNLYKKVANVLSISSLCQPQTVQCTGTTFAFELHASFLMPSE